MKLLDDGTFIKVASQRLRTRLLFLRREKALNTQHIGYRLSFMLYRGGYPHFENYNGQLLQRKHYYQ